MSALPIYIAALAFFISAHSVMWTAAASWHSKTATFWRTDPDHARQRNAAPPWHVRYTKWLDARLPGGAR